MTILAVQIQGKVEYTYGVGRNGIMYRWSRYLSEPIDKWYWENWEYVPSVGF